jgi:lysophospholipase L1-like esterase
MKIALIGDSQSEVLWPRVQKALPQHQFVLVRTQRGWAESHYRNEAKLEQQLADAKPDLVVIELGGNNATLNDEKYQASVDWMLNAARKSGAKSILYFGPAAATKEPFKSNKEWTRTFQSKYLPSQAGVTWYDNFPHTQTGHADGVHFGQSTYSTWAAAIVPVIESAATGSGGFSLVPRTPGGKVAAGIVLVAALALLGYALSGDGRNR